MSKLFGDNQAFSAGLEMQVTDKSGKPITMPGKLSFDAGKQRFEVNLADMEPYLGLDAVADSVGEQLPLFGG